MGEEAQGKWAGKTTVEITSIKPEQIWPFMADFCNIHKWSPSLENCYHEEGTVGEIGVVRRCTTKAFQPSDGSATGYAKEKLVKFDPTARSLSYLVLENNFGVPVGGYVGTMKVSESPGGCEIEWSFVSEPIEGWKLEDLCSFMEANFKAMGDRMEAAAKKQMAEEAEGKWVGKASAQINGVKPDQIWPFLADDFCDLHKWFPTIDSCSHVEGTVGEVGLVRCCKTKAFLPADGSAEGDGYAKEKLVKFDPTERSLSYEILENNFGMPVGSYVATMTVSESSSGCEIEWSFVSEPIKWLKLEDYCSYMDVNLKLMADRMVAAAKATAA